MKCVERLLQALISAHVLAMPMMLHSLKTEHCLADASQATERQTVVTPPPTIFERCSVVRAVFYITGLRTMPNLCPKIVHPNPKLAAKPIDSKKTINESGKLLF